MGRDDDLDLLTVSACLLYLLVQEPHQAQLALWVQVRFWFLNDQQRESVCFIGHEQ